MWHLLEGWTVAADAAAGRVTPLPGGDGAGYPGLHLETSHSQV